MSTEDLLNQPTENVEPAPDHDSYVPMPFYEPFEEIKRQYSSDSGGLHRAAADLDKSREAAVEQQPRLLTNDQGVIERKYQVADGKPSPSNETITIEKGAEDLTRVRETDIRTISPTLEEIAGRVDAARSQYQAWEHGLELPPPQPAAQPAAQPDPQTQQAAEFAQATGVDPDIAAAIANPKVRAALQAEVAQVEQARQQYAQGAKAAATVAAASLLASFPELANVPTNQLQTAVNAIAQVSPQRAQAINAHLEKVTNLWAASQQAEAAKQQIYNQRAQEFVKAEDAKFEASIAKENPETVQRVKQNVVSVLETEYGIDKNQLRELWQNEPLLRTASAQRLLYDITRLKLAERDIAGKRDRSVPPVQRPGTSQPRSSADDFAITSALKAFNADPTPQNAAALLLARRANR